MATMATIKEMLEKADTKSGAKKEASAGRPSLYTDELAAAICRRIANGEGLRAICRGDDMPGRQTVLDWLDDDKKESFRIRYTRARVAQADYLDEAMQEVADSATPEDVQVGRLRVSTMQWRASKLAPKKYGDKLDIGVSGSLQTVSDDQLDTRLAQLLGKAGIGVNPGGNDAPDGSD